MQEIVDHPEDSESSSQNSIYKNSLLKEWTYITKNLFLTLKDDLLIYLPELLKNQSDLNNLKRNHQTPTPSQINYARKSLKINPDSPSAIFARAEITKEIWVKNHQRLGKEVIDIAAETTKVLRKFPHAIVSLIKRS